MPDDNFIKLSFNDDFLVESSLDDCAQDYVEVYNMRQDGTMDLIGSYCQANPPPAILLSGTNVMVVVFRSDNRFANSGFFGHYSMEHYSLPAYIRNRLTSNGNVFFVSLIYSSI